MKIKHDNIVDTSIIYDHNRGPPSKPSLKSLAEKHLNRQIQAGEGQGLGHSSIEDAKACLDLVKLKIIEGKLFESMWVRFLYFNAYQKTQIIMLVVKSTFLVTQMVIHLSRYWYHMVKLESMISTQTKSMI